MAQQLLTRYGIVTREVARAEALGGGFSSVYDVFKKMEDRGRVRRGYFATGVGAAQFAMPAALDLLRSMRQDPESPEVLRLSAADPANPYGAILEWPSPDAADASGRGPTRSAGALVVLVNGRVGAWIARGRQALVSFLPEAEPDRGLVARAVSNELAHLAHTGERRVGGLLVSEINGAPAAAHPLAQYLVEAGFVATALGFQRPRAGHATSRQAPAYRSRRAVTPDPPPTEGADAAGGDVDQQELLLDEEEGW